jgi:ribonuclease HIII
MNQYDREIDQLVAQFWREKGVNADVAKQVRGRALGQPLTSAIVAGRALSVIIGSAQPNAWIERIGNFKIHVAQLIERCHQVDKLGDTDTDPAAVFDVLGEDSADIEIDSFDVEKLRQVRLGRSRPDAARAFLQALGATALPSTVRTELEAAATELSDRANTYPCHALFEVSGQGVALGVQARGDSQGRVIGFNQADEEMGQQAEAVLRHYFPEGAGWDVEWELPYGGGSIGLALAIAALVGKGRAQPDPLLAATGRIDANLNVGPVDAVPEKVQGAAAAGFRRILVPAANEKEARDAVGDREWLTIIPIERLDQLEAKLSGLSGAVPIGSDGAIRFIRKLAPRYELDVTGEESLANSYRLTVADAATEAFIDVFHGTKSTVTVGGKGSAKAAAERLLAENLPKARTEPRLPFSVLIASQARRERLQTSLIDRGAEELPVHQNEVWRYQLVEGASKATIILYTTGKCLVQAGQAPAHDEARHLVEAALEGLGGIPQPGVQPVQVETTPEARSDPNVPHIGTDEAGKGDYFGPLVCAAVFVNGASIEKLRALGVRDSKTLSDKTIHRLAEEIRSFGQIWAVTTIPPARYNSLYSEMRREGKNLNTLVAWGHARSIEDLLGRRIDAEYAVIDKFADERYLREKLLASTRRSGMRFDHRVRGESDIAVAAASILARDAFVSWLAERSRKLGIVLPKGASPEVITVARRIAAEGGEKALAELAKLSFKTTQSVLGSTDG